MLFQHWVLTGAQPTFLREKRSRILHTMSFPSELLTLN